MLWSTVFRFGGCLERHIPTVLAHQFVASGKIADDGSHKLCGSFKIMSDGIITRFTGLSKADWNNAMRNAEAEYKAKYEVETTEQATEQKVAV